MTMRGSWKAFLVGSGVAFALTACGGGGSGASSPEDVLKNIISAAKAGDAKAAAANFPTKEMLMGVMDCPGESAERLDRFAKVEEKIAKEFDEIKGLEVLRSEKGEEKEFKAGDDVDGCKAKADFKMAKVKVVFKTPEGKEDGDSMRFFVIGGKYYLAKM